MPTDLKKYPPNWAKEIVPRIRKRAGESFDKDSNRTQHAKCEKCGVGNYSIGSRLDWGKFIPLGGNALHDLLGEGKSYPDLNPISYKDAKKFVDDLNQFLEDDDKKYFMIVLTVAHLDHDETNWDVKDERLRAWCQYCHLTYDAKEKARRRRVKKYSNSFFPLDE